MLRHIATFTRDNLSALIFEGEQRYRVELRALTRDSKEAIVAVADCPSIINAACYAAELVRDKKGG